MLEENEEILWYKEYFNNFQYIKDINRYKFGIIAVLIILLFTLIVYIFININYILLIFYSFFYFIIIFIFLKFIKEIRKKKESKYKEVYILTTMRIIKRFFKTKYVLRDYFLTKFCYNRFKKYKINSSQSLLICIKMNSLTYRI